MREHGKENSVIRSIKH